MGFGRNETEVHHSANRRPDVGSARAAILGWSSDSLGVLLTVQLLLNQAEPLLGIGCKIIEK